MTITRRFFGAPTSLLTGLLFAQLILLSLTLASAQTIPYDTLVKQANALYEQKNYEASITKYQAAFAIRKGNYVDLYNGACSAALAGNKEMAMTLLKESLEHGYSNATHLQTDADLYILHPAIEWPEVIRLVEENSKKYSSDAVYQQILQALESNKPEDLVALSSSDFKATSSAGLSKMVNAISVVLKECELTFSKMTPATSQSMSIMKGTSTSKKSWDYSWQPVFFGQPIGAILTRPIGYHVSFELIDSRPGWKLSNLTFQDDRVDAKYDIGKSVRDFLSNNAECKMVFVEISEKKTLAGSAMMKPADLKINVDDMKFAYYVVDAKTNEQRATHTFAIAMSREVPYTASKGKDGSQEFANIFDKLKTKETQVLEFVFFENVDVMLISTGKEYGFYKVGGSENIKKIIKSNLSGMAE